MATEFPAFTRVLHWKVYVDPLHYGHPEGCRIQRWSLDNVCQILCQLSQRSLEIYVVSQNLNILDYDAEKMLQPLKLLRGMKRLSFNVVDACWSTPVLSKDQQIALIFSDPETAAEWTTLVRGNDVVERPFQMYLALLEYAQSFEHHVRSKLWLKMKRIMPGFRLPY